MRRFIKMRGSILSVFFSLVCFFAVSGWAFGETQILGGVETEGTLKISIYDNGDIGVHRYVGGGWQQQWYSGNCKSTLTYINGTDYAVEGSYFNGGWFDADATPLTTVSNTSTVDTAVLILERAGVVRVAQTIYYPAGAAHFNVRWEIQNLSSQTVNDLRFFSGGDTYSSGDDCGSGFWHAPENAVGVTKVIGTEEQYMVIQGNTLPHAYESRYYGDVGNSVVANALTSAIDPDPYVDNGMAMEWRKNSLAPGDTWTIDATEKFVTKEVSNISVTAPISSQVAPGSSVDLTYTVANLTETATSVTLNQIVDLVGWTAVILSPSSPFDLPGNGAQEVLIQVACPPGTPLGTVAKVTLKATSDIGSASDFCSVEAAQVPTITSHPSDCSVCIGESASFSITAENADSYQWQEFAGAWRDVIDEGVYSGATTPTLHISSAAGEMNGYQYRCVATNDYGSTESNTATLTVRSCGLVAFYVDIVNGNDENNGSKEAPWKTVHHAIAALNAAPPGSYVLHIALGTYSVANGEADAGLILTQSNVTIIGAIGSGPVLDGAGAVNWTDGLAIAGSNVTVENLYVAGFSKPDAWGIIISSGAENTLKACKVYGNYGGLSIYNADRCSIAECEIYNNADDGICIDESANGVITQNKIYSNAGDNSDGIIVGGCSPEISRNEVYDNTFNIFVEAYGSEIASPVISNNVVYELTPGTVSYGILVSSNDTATASPTLSHNTIDGGEYTGIALEKYGTGAVNPTIQYNIVTNFRQYGIHNTGGTPVLDYNDVWNNSTNYSGCETGPNSISQDPLYGSYALQSGSPCIDRIPPAGDPAALDYPGYSRPKGEGKDMGAYEFVGTVEYPYTLPGGTGLVTDYRIFTVPLDMRTGADLQHAMEAALGEYDDRYWRVFAYLGGEYLEMNTPAFDALPVVPGMGFWIITLYTNPVPFEGGISPDGVPYELVLPPDWSMVALPWVSTPIDLGNIFVTDGVGTYSITDPSNPLTQQCVWDYTGTGPYSGYEKRDAGSYTLQCGTGYFIKVLSDSPVRLIIPPNNAVGSSLFPNRPERAPLTVRDDEEPPPPPGAAYGPVPDIKANGQDGPVVVPFGTRLSVAIGLDPAKQTGQWADWWVAAQTPFGWFSYVHPNGWQPGIHWAAQAPLFAISPLFDVLNIALPAGSYTFYFAVDNNMDGNPDATWIDSVSVRVE